MDKSKEKFLTYNQKASVVDDTNLIVGNVIASDGSVDRHGESVNPKGWELKNFKQNPVVLYAHDYWSLPIGKVTKIWEESNKLLCNIKFATTDFAQQAFQLFKDGILNAVSVGFIPLEWGVSGKDKYTIMKQELIELSVVPVPANPNALAKSFEGNAKKDELIEKVKKLYELAEAEVKSQKEAEEKAKKEKEEAEAKVKAEAEAKEKEAKEKAEKEAQEKKELLEKSIEIVKEAGHVVLTKELFDEMEKQITELKTLKTNKSEELTKALSTMRSFLVKSDSHIGNALKSLKALTELSEKGGEK